MSEDIKYEAIHLSPPQPPPSPLPLQLPPPPPSKPPLPQLSLAAAAPPSIDLSSPPLPLQPPPPPLLHSQPPPLDLSLAASPPPPIDLQSPSPAELPTPSTSSSPPLQLLPPWEQPSLAAAAAAAALPTYVYLPSPPPELSLAAGGAPHSPVDLSSLASFLPPLQPPPPPQLPLPPHPSLIPPPPSMPPSMDLPPPPPLPPPPSPPPPSPPLDLPSPPPSPSPAEPARKCQSQAHVDGGWAWVVMVASFAVSAVVDGVGFSVGILLSSLQKEFGANNQQVSWMSSVLNGTYLMIGPAVSFFVNRYGCRKMSLLGCLIAAVSFGLSTLCSSIQLLIVVYGLLGGVGLGFLYLPSVIIIGHYFHARLSLALGFTACGSGMGAFALAPVFSIFVERHTWRGATYLAVALILLCVLACATFRPLNSAGGCTKTCIISAKSSILVVSLSSVDADQSKAVTGTSGGGGGEEGKTGAAEEEEKCLSERLSIELEGRSLHSYGSSVYEKGEIGENEKREMGTQTAEGERDVTKGMQAYTDSSTDTTFPIGDSLTTCCRESRSKDQESMVPSLDRHAQQGTTSEEVKNLDVCEEGMNVGDAASISFHLMPVSRFKAGSMVLVTSPASQKDTNTSNPMDANTSNPRDTNTSNPMDANTSNPRDTNTSNHMDANTSNPMDANASNPMDANTSNPMDTNTSNPMDTNTSIPMDANTSNPMDTNTSNPMDANTSNPMDTNASIPMDTSTSNHVNANTSNHVDANTSNPMDTNTSTPMDTNTSNPMNANTSNPMDTNTSNPMDANTSNPMDVNTSNPMDANTSNPMDVNTSNPMVANTSNPMDANTSNPMDANTSNPMNINTSNLRKSTMQRETQWKSRGEAPNDIPVRVSQTVADESNKTLGSKTSLSEISKERDVDFKTCTFDLSDVTVSSKKGKSSCLQHLHRLMWLPFKYNLSLMKRPSVVLYGIACFLMSVGMYVPATFLPPMADSLGFEPSLGAFLVSTIGMGNVVGRLLTGLLAHYRPGLVLAFNYISLLLAGLFTCLLPLLTKYYLMVGYSLLFGACIGMFVVLQLMVLIELLGFEHLTNAFGVVNMYQGIGTIVGPPLAGLMADATDDLSSAFFTAGAVFVVAGVISIPLHRAAISECRQVKGSLAHMYLPSESN